MDRERRAVLRGVAALTGVAVGGGSGIVAGGNARETFTAVRQQVDADLRPGVTLFDLDGDDEYAVSVERAGEGVRDDDHPRPIHVTSGGRSTVDYAVAAVEPPAGTTLGGLDELAYDYRGGTADATPGSENGTATTDEAGAANGDTAGLAPGRPFVAVENADGRHGAYFAPGDAAPAVDQWRTFDVLDRLTGGGVGGGDADAGRWFEYTAIEDGYDGESFEDAVERFGADARLVRVGVGVGDAVAPTVLDAYYGNLVIDGEAREFPVEVVDRVS